jgi:glycosyltransferase involved in cell wall biosynthesis
MTFSIITINYNNRNGLKKTIESVINQTFHDYEFIIIDGGSSDGSIDIIKEYEDKISYWISEPDHGIYHAMNKGIEKAKGDYLNFMNSGDCLYQDNILQSIAKKQISADMIVGKDCHYNNTSKQRFIITLPTRLSMMTFINDTLPHQSTFFKKELFKNSKYDENLKYAADMKFFLQKICIEQCKVQYINEIICLREPDGISMKHLDECKLEYNKIISEFLPAGAIKDYQTLHLLDKSTMYKLMDIIEDTRCRKWLTYCIKIINRLNNYF